MRLMRMAMLIAEKHRARRPACCREFLREISRPSPQPILAPGLQISPGVVVAGDKHYMSLAGANELAAPRLDFQQNRRRH